MVSVRYEGVVGVCKNYYVLHVRDVITRSGGLCVLAKELISTSLLALRGPVADPRVTLPSVASVRYEYVTYTFPNTTEDGRYIVYPSANLDLPAYL